MVEFSESFRWKYAAGQSRWKNIRKTSVYIFRALNPICAFINRTNMLEDYESKARKLENTMTILVYFMLNQRVRPTQ